MSMLMAEKRKCYFAGVMGTESFDVDVYVDDLLRKVYIDDDNLINSPVMRLDGETVRDVTEANGGYSHWMDGIYDAEMVIGGSAR